MPTVTKQPAAELDIEQIALYLLEQGAGYEVTDKFVNDLHDRFAADARQPQMGSLCDDLGTDLRCFSFRKNYVAIYPRSMTASTSSGSSTRLETTPGCFMKDKVRPSARSPALRAQALCVRQFLDKSLSMSRIVSVRIADPLSSLPFTKSQASM